MVVDSAKMALEGVVYNNCHPSCKGNVDQVFITRLINGRNIEVLTRTGDLKVFPIHESGIEGVTVDELNAKGVPFRSWVMPVAGSGWYLAENYLYTPLDIEGVSLRADAGGHWDFVPTPKNSVKLEEIEPAVKFAGCSPEDHCFVSAASDLNPASIRHFKAPRVCEPVLKHEQDEPVDDQGAPDSKPPSSMGPAPTAHGKKYSHG